MKNRDKIGSWTSVLIGLPFGFIFSFSVLYLSLFPFIDMGVFLIGGSLFWHPLIWAGVLPVSFVFLLWTAGKKINKHLEKKYSIIWTSFLFTLFVNSWLFGLILLIFIIGRFFFSPMLFSETSNIPVTAIFLTFFTYLFSTAFTSLTIGLLIVSITKNRINALFENSNINEMMNHFELDENTMHKLFNQFWIVSENGENPIIHMGAITLETTKLTSKSKDEIHFYIQKLIKHQYIELYSKDPLIFHFTEKGKVIHSLEDISQMVKTINLDV